MAMNRRTFLRTIRLKRVLHTMFNITIIIALLAAPFSSALAGGPTPKGEDKPKGPKKDQTSTTGDPIYTSGGEFRQYWTLLSLNSLIPIEFTLIYAPDLFNKGINYFGSFPFPPGVDLLAFSSNTIIRIKEYTDRQKSPAQRLVNIFRGDDTLVFQVDEQGNYIPVNPLKYQLKKLGSWYYLMDPEEELVYIFRSQNINLDLVYAWDTGSVDQFIYTEGQVAYIIDRNGNTLTYTYNQDNNPVHIEDGLGRALNFTYRTFGWFQYLSEVSDDDGRTVTFEYSSLNCRGGEQTVLTSFSDPEGNWTTFEYYDPQNTDCNLIQKIILPLGNAHLEQTWAKNPLGIDAVKTQTDAYGNQLTLDWELGENGEILTTVTYPDGTQREFVHLNDRFPIMTNDALGNSAGMDYNSDFQMTTITDRMGDTTEITYHPESGKIETYTNARGETTHYTYEPHAQTFTNPANNDQVTFTFYDLARVDYPDGSSEAYGFDEHWNVTEWIDQAGNIWKYSYNDRGQVVSETNPAGGTTEYTHNDDATLASSFSEETGLTLYDYDEYDRLTTITHSDGSQFTYIYDLMDRTTEIINENGNSITFTYDANGNVIAITDPAGETIEYVYDLMDRVIELREPTGGITTFTYDTMGRMSSVADPTNVTTRLSYDPNGWLSSFSLGDYTWSGEHDEEGILTSITSPSGNISRFLNDQIGAGIGSTSPLGNAYAVTRDFQNRITSYTNPRGLTTVYSYDPRGFLSSVTLPNGDQVSYTWNALWLLEEITDLNGNTWSFQSTQSGRYKAIVDPLGNTWEFTYNQRGWIDQILFPDGSTATHAFDQAGNVTEISFSDGTVIQFVYDEVDRITQTNGLSLVRGVGGRLIDTVNGETHYTATYDLAGRLTSVAYNDGAFTVTYTYDPSTGLLTGVSDDLTGTTIAFSYDEDLNLVGISRSNGVETRFTWDVSGNLVGIQDGDFTDLQYQLNENEHVTGYTGDMPINPMDLLTDSTLELSYDAASQISSPGYAYDAQGRMARSPEHTFKWDDASRLIAIDDEQLTYNGFNALTSSTKDGQQIAFDYNYAIETTPIVAERKPEGEPLRYYVWTPDGQLLYMIDARQGNQVYFYHFDHLGSTLALTDQAGKLTDAYAYSPYGQLLAHQGENDQPFTFIGEWGVRQADARGTLFYMRSRYYDALTGRFISRDPAWPDLLHPLYLSPYTYTGGSPTYTSDPSGLQVSAPYEVVTIYQLLDNLSRDAQQFNTYFEPNPKQEQKATTVKSKRLLNRLMGRRHEKALSLFDKFFNLIKKIRLTSSVPAGRALPWPLPKAWSQKVGKQVYKTIWHVGKNVFKASNAALAKTVTKIFSFASKANTISTLVQGAMGYYKVYKHFTSTNAQISHKVHEYRKAPWWSLTRLSVALGDYVGGLIYGKEDAFYSKTLEERGGYSTYEEYKAHLAEAKNR
jgi:RHS repeat-associated protein